MSIDIRSGDLLVVGSVEYPIRSIAHWSGFANRTLRGATIDATTKRSPGIVAGKRGAPATNLTDLLITPLDPVDPETKQRMALETPHTLLETYVADTSGFAHLIVEDLAR